MVVDSFLRMKICVIGIKVIAQNKGGVMLRGFGLRFQVDQRKLTPNKDKE